MDQVAVPVNADPSSPRSLSNQSTVTAERRADVIEQQPSLDDASAREAKDDVTVTATEDPLDLERHKRDVTQRQMKADHPSAKPKHMKVRFHLPALCIPGVDQI